MIYTITFNPALDYIMTIDELEVGAVNRSKCEKILPGGKGINVSYVLTNLGIDNTALGFVAGFTGKNIENILCDYGCKTDFVVLNDGLSRINVKLMGEKETEVNGNGPHITKEDVRRLYEKLDRLTSDDVLVMAGSIPTSLPTKIYSDIMKFVADKDVKVVVDATGDLLVNCLAYKPFLIKPNNFELEQIFNIKLESRDDIVKCAYKLKDMGAVNVLVSMGKEGAILVAEDGKAYDLVAPDGHVINSVGAGDSMVAGFLAGYVEKKDYKYAFKLSVATGSASAFSDELASKEEIMKVFKAM
mgnify:CR=1 FL=1